MRLATQRPRCIRGCRKRPRVSRASSRTRSCSACTLLSGLLNDLIRSQHQRGRNRQAESLRRLEVDDQLVLRRLLDGKIGWLGALEDLVDEEGGTAKHLIVVWPIGQQTACLAEYPEL